MACLVSMTFSVRLSASHSFANEVSPRNSALVKFSATAAKPSTCCNTNGVVSNLNRCYFQHPLTTPKDSLPEILYCQMNVDSFSHTIIFGYWVGPDVDDGWGYVEAFVLQDGESKWVIIRVKPVVDSPLSGQPTQSTSESALKVKRSVVRQGKFIRDSICGALGIHTHRTSMCYMPTCENSN